MFGRVVGRVPFGAWRTHSAGSDFAGVSRTHGMPKVLGEVQMQEEGQQYGQQKDWRVGITQLWIAREVPRLRSA